MNIYECRIIVNGINQGTIMERDLDAAAKSALFLSSLKSAQRITIECEKTNTRNEYYHPRIVGNSMMCELKYGYPLHQGESECKQ